MGRLEDKVALITGSSAGQGAAEARLFAAEGATVCITDVADAAGRALADQINANGGKARYIHLDVVDPAQWKRAIDEVKRECGGLHILVNNAGTISRKGIANIGLDDWHRVMEVNLTGPLLGMQIATPLIRDSGGGSIINVSSIAGLTAHYDAAYGASKWGLRGLTKSAALEFVDWGVRVNSIHPGQIADTSFARGAMPGHLEANRVATPMGRQGTTEECAQLVLFLASAESSYITGAEIAIDGGLAGCGLMRMRAKLTQEIVRGERRDGRTSVAVPSLPLTWGSP
jgi:3alpha(or 20beta)-hydroxysteroid dehydrogenase